MVKISVIIPVYNVEEYLKQCLDSIVNQSLNEIEIICINDGSADKSLKILEDYAKNDSRFVIVSQENCGQGAARNRGLDIAQGEYVVFVDPDDWIEENALEKIYACFKSNDTDVVQFDYKDYNDYTKITKKIDFSKFLKKKFNYEIKDGGFYSWKEIFHKKFKYSKFTVWSKAYSLKFLRENDIKFPLNKHGEDDVFSAQVFLETERICYLKDFLYVYRTRKNSAVNSLSDEHFCIFENVHTVKEFLIKKNLYEYLKKSFWQYTSEVISRHYFNIPPQSRHLYRVKACKVLNKQEYIKFLLKTASGNSFAENIFSLKNERRNAIKYKVLTILGLKFKMVPKMNEGI